MGTRGQKRHHNTDHHTRSKFCRRPSLSLQQPFHLKALFLLLTALILLALYPAPPCHGQSDYAEAYEQSRDEFKAVQGSAAATKSTLDATKIVVDKAEAQLRLNIQQLQRANQPVPENLKNAAAKFKNARMTLKRSQDLLDNFSVYSGKVTAVTDVYDKVVELRTKMNEDSNLMGNLAGALRGLGTMMVEGSDYIPVIGRAVKVYGEVTIGMVDKLGGVAKTIDSQRNQGQIGRGTHSTGERNRIFHEFQRNHPELIADVYVPSLPAYLYEPFGSGEGNSVIWDEEARQFSVVPADIPARDIFRMTLLLETRLSAADLKILMEHWNASGALHLKAANGLHKLLNGVRHGPFIDIVSRVDRTTNGFLFRLLQDPDLFAALYVFDPKTRDEMHRSMKAVHDGLVAEGALDLAEKLRGFARKHKLGIAFTVPEPVAPPKPVQKKAEKKKEPVTADKKKSAAPEPKKMQEVNKVAPVPPKPKPAAKPPSPVPPKPQKEIKKAAKTPAPKPPPKKKPSVKAGQVVGSCSACIQNGMDCACGKAACRCCAKGDKNCNAYDL
jgi:hypothetical protein